MPSFIAVTRCRPSLLLAVLLFAAVPPPVSAIASPEARRERIRELDAAPTPIALARKARSEARLAAEGVPLHRQLPVIADESGARPRSKAEVAQRTMALMVVAMKGAGMEQARVDAISAHYGLGAHFSPNEVAFLLNPSPTAQQGMQFTWRVEAAWALLWALGYVESLDMPVAQCDVDRAMAFTAQADAQTFIDQATLRPLSELLDQADLIYRYHWVVVDARINGREPPAGLDASVIQERHHALNWLIGYMDQAWDEVTTDT